MEKIDLHMHSLYSDGVYDVSTLLKMAEKEVYQLYLLQTMITARHT